MEGSTESGPHTTGTERAFVWQKPGLQEGYKARLRRKGELTKDLSPKRTQNIHGLG